MVARYDYEYERCGVRNVFLAVEPLRGKRIDRITDQKTKRDWDSFVDEIDRAYSDAERITLVMDNLNTHVVLRSRITCLTMLSPARNVILHIKVNQSPNYAP